jgi:general secretion pathway protein B
MSYILDALTKAAQQRDRQAPVVQRLLSPAPRPRSAWSPTSGRLLAALAVKAAFLGSVLCWWLWPAITAPPEPVAAPATTPAPTPAAESPRPLVKLDPLPSTGAKLDKAAPASIERSAETSATATAAPSSPPATPKPSPQAPAQSSPQTTGRPTSPSPATPAPPRSGTPTVQSAPPVAAARPAMPQEASGLKLEALIYADVPAERMVFINGRRYREGEAIDGRLKIEEIREDGVELSDQGRRFVLRVSR